MTRGLIDRTTDRTPIAGHDGRSGAVLERAVLDDGRRVVIKTASPVLDLAMCITGDIDGRERRLWCDGTLDRLPPGVEHCILDAHADADGRIVTVMSDLEGDVVGWDDRLTVAESERIVDAAARVHHTFAHATPPAAAMAAERWLTMLSPTVMSLHADGPNPIARAAVQGWEILNELVPPRLARRIAGVHADPGPLSERLRAHGVTLSHGDLFPVNVAVRDTSIVLLDWGLATAAAGVLDMATFVVHAHTDAPADALVDRYVDATRCGSGGAADGFLAALCAYGWNAALSATSPDRTGVEARERLDWWVARIG